MVKKYRRKPIVIEAIQWTGDNTSEVLNFGQGKVKYRQYEYSPNGRDILYGEELYIETLEGELRANKGDYIIKGVRGEFYPCKPDIFKEIYEETNKIQNPQDILKEISGLLGAVDRDCIKSVES